MEIQPYPAEMHLVVGGYHYYLDTNDLLNHSKSYFAHMLKDELIKDKTAEVTLNRNGKVFRHVSYYLYTGHMDPNCKPIDDLDVLVALRTEADFYGLPDLVTLCDYRIKYNIDDVLAKQQNAGLFCDCVRGNAEKSTDALIIAMDIFRPPTVATSHLTTFKYDTLEYKSVFDLLRSARDSLYRSVHKCSFAHKCYKVDYNYGLSVNPQIHSAFSKWPLAMGTEHATTSLYERHLQVYIYIEGGFCIRHVPTTVADGSFLYIFNSAHTGGRVTTKVNGEEVSIESPGDCMALLPGCSYSVETVTSGFLALYEYTVKVDGCDDDDGDCEENKKCGEGDAMDTMYDDGRREDEGADDDERREDEYADDGDDDSDDDSELGSFDGSSSGQSGEGGGGVEMTSDSDDSFDSNSQSNDSGLQSKALDTPLVWQVHGNHSTEITAERSVELKSAIDAALLTHEGVVICLSTYYPTGHSSNQARRCETDPALLKRFDADLHAHLCTFYEVTVVTVTVNAETESGGSTARVLDFPHDADMRLKVVAPMQSVSLDRSESDTMLLTGLLCFAHE